jgi:nucleoside-diphosphate-sugar epimerase
MRIVLTGGTGYIGSRFISKCLEHNYNVTLLSRVNPMIKGLDWQYFNLQDAKKISLPNDTSHFFHMATESSLVKSPNIKLELASAKMLLDLCQSLNAKFIFLSSQAAQEKSISDYGLTKWHIEKDVLASNGFVIRVGQVYGGKLDGLFGVLSSIVKKHHILPFFIPIPSIQPIHIDDLNIALIQFIKDRSLKSKIYSLGADIPINFSIFLNEIAKSRFRFKRFFLPIPAFFVNLLCLLPAGILKNKSAFLKLKSFFELPLMNTREDMAILKLSLRDLSSGMHPSGSNRRRSFLIEGWILFKYVFKSPPNFIFLRRYIKFIEKKDLIKPLHLPESLKLFSGTLCFFEYFTFYRDWNLVLKQRLDFVLFISESDRFNYVSFFKNKKNFILSLFLLIFYIINEVAMRLLFVLSLPFFYFFMRSLVKKYE